METCESAAQALIRTMRCHGRSAEGPDVPEQGRRSTLVAGRSREHSWLSILNPSHATFESTVKPLLDEAHERLARSRRKLTAGKLEI